MDSEPYKRNENCTGWHCFVRDVDNGRSFLVPWLPPFEGDVRIAVKEAVDKSGTMLVFKDSYLKIVPNSQMKKLAEISNKILNNAQEAQVYAKKKFTPIFRT